ncbi:DUF3549 family protein [Neiella marina]|uniref:DUF3549 family protein n=1 Tax=Neiella holothuriorum TaxID=2870530 RepID=A0ABS7EHQ4_9GAMM|nr:DUF3549 family protein [Neiella holothuriorum]MBW8191750.1 DUF3549 family protein [Neiella holothuriorum]
MSTIDQVLTLGNCQYSVYDMGRVIRRIDKQNFVDFEQGAAPYPYPIQGHACFAVVFSKPDQVHTPYLWLLKLPLDEVSKLVFAARDDFLRMVIEALGQDIANAEIDTEALNNHAYSLKPSMEKLAVLNARIRAKLHQPASIYYESAHNYFTQYPSETGWQAIGFQGIADLVERMDKATAQQLSELLDQLPEPAFCALSQCLEHCQLPPSLQLALLGLPPSKRDPFWLRSLTGGQVKALTPVISELLDASPSVDMLITLCARHWQQFSNAEQVHKLLESVVACPQGHEVFTSLVADLSALPECRDAALTALRAPNRSAALAAAIGQLFQQLARP